MKIIKYLIMTVIFTVILSGCSSGSNGIVTLSLTDAPMDASNVSGVYVTISSIEYHLSGGSWVTADDFSETQYNLLNLTNGETSHLSTLELPSGKITQIRFGIDDSLKGDVYGCYVEYNDGTARSPLTMPGGTDLKFTNEFDVPLNGDTLSVIADFDVRKSVVSQGNGTFSLKPVIRLIVENEAGKIAGTLTGNTGSVIVYAYENGSWDVSEADEPAQDETRFPHAVSSGKVDIDGTFVISFLAPMDYKLVAVDGVSNAVLNTSVNVTVSAGSTVKASIEL